MTPDAECSFALSSPKLGRNSITLKDGAVASHCDWTIMAQAQRAVMGAHTYLHTYLRIRMKNGYAQCVAALREAISGTMV